MTPSQLSLALQDCLAFLRGILSTESAETQVQALRTMRLYLDVELERVSR